jgi:hypothetical protein
LAITRVSGPRTIAVFPVSQISLERDSFTLLRLENGRLAATFETEGSGTASTLRLTTLDPTGVTHSPVVTLDATPNGRLLEDPVMAAAANGSFFVAWTNASSGIDLTKSDAPGRVYSANGSALGAKFHLSTIPSDGEMIPSVARLGNGNFVTAWSDTSGGPIFDLDAEILGRVFKANGAPAGGEFRINVTTGGFQLGTQSLALPDGRTLVVWHRGELEGFTDVDSIDLRGRFLNANGTPVGGELLLDTIGPGHNYEPQRTELVGLGNGGFALVWEEYVGPITASTAKEIHLQRFSATGGKVGGEILIDRVPKDWSYLWISPVELANGGYAIVWRTFDPSDNPGRVFARVFDMKGAEIGHEVELTPIGNSGGGGLTNIVDLELMANGQVMAIGEILGGGKVTFATQVFDFGDERLIGTGAADKLYGKYAVADQIFGLAGNDTIFAASGSDVIAGGTGRDTMTGGANADRFDFDAVAETGRTAATRDIIKDFVHNVDKIDLSTIDANGGGAGDAAFTFLAANGAAFTGAGAELRWVQNNPAGTANDKTIVEGDLNGDRVADFQIELTGLKVLTAGDFIL